MAQGARARRRRGELPDRHESRRRSEPGAGPCDDHRQLRRHAVERRSRPGAEDGDDADLRRDDRRPDRQCHHRHRRHRYRPALHGHLREPRHAPHRQRHHHGGEGGDGQCCSKSRPRSSRSSAADLETDGKGNIHVKGAPRKSIPVFEAALAAHFKHGKTISGRGMFLQTALLSRARDRQDAPATCYAHACTVAEVEVDTETGEVAVLSLKSAYEVGRALNPKMVEQQIVGGAWMGMSHALYETTEPYYPDRAHGPVDFNEYLMPGPGDLPEFESVDPRAPVRRTALWRQGRRRDDRQFADPGDRQRHLRRGRRAGRFASDHAGEGAARHPWRTASSRLRR